MGHLAETPDDVRKLPPVHSCFLQDGWQASSAQGKSVTHNKEQTPIHARGMLHCYEGKIKADSSQARN